MPAPSAAKSEYILPSNGATVAHAYLQRLALTPEVRAFLVKKHGTYLPILWKEVHEQVLGAFDAIHRAGLKVGDRIAILSNSRPEWMAVDLANLTSGRVTIPIYQSAVPDEVEYILRDSGASLLFLEDKTQYEKVKGLAILKEKRIPLFSFEPVEGTPDLPVTYLHKAVAEAKERLKSVDVLLRNEADKVTPEMVATIVYTSGTTGLPKGAILSHSNFQGELTAAVEEFRLGPEDVTVTFLPFAHILGRIESLFAVYGGLGLGFAENVNTVAQNIGEIRPTVLVSVPRIYEKIFSKMNSEIENGPPMKKKIFQWAVGIGRAVARHRSDRTPIPMVLQAKFLVADQLVFSKVRAKLGGRLRFTISGGAPLSPDLCEFFHACGIKILEGYGLTETTAAVAVNRPDDFCFGTVGKGLGPVEFRIAEDGELLIKGGQVFQGYHQKPEETRESLKDGWFATGDIAEITERGFIRITDRKKELIVLSGGKKVAPQKLENMLKTCRFISNAMVCGDKQKYIGAVVTLNEPEVLKYMETAGTPLSGREALYTSAEVRGLIEVAIKGFNEQLASYETIKRFSLIPEDFTVENGMITPSLKLKRKPILKKYEEVIAGLFS